jgi:type IV pilus assembly protein PilC
MTEVQGSKDVLFRKFVDYVQQNKVVFETYWTGIVGLMFYLAALSTIAVVVSVIFAAHVMPSFSAMFSGFGATLPDFTQRVFAFSAVGLPIVVVILVTIVSLSAWFVTAFYRRIQRFEPLRRWPAWLPVAGRISATYNFGLFINFAHILLQCGVSAERAIKVAANLSNQAPDFDHEKLIRSGSPFGDMPAIEQLAIAARLGQIDRELAYQCEQHVATLSTALIGVRERFSIVLKLVLYFFIATLIVAMYLPIFKMGSVI